MVGMVYGLIDAYIRNSGMIRILGGVLGCAVLFKKKILKKIKNKPFWGEGQVVHFLTKMLLSLSSPM